MEFTIIFVISLIILIALVICIIIIDKNYSDFILKNSISIEKLRLINGKYQFHSVKHIEYSHSYDNENFYSLVSPKDFLIYKLQDTKEEVQKSISNTIDNQNKYDFYKSAVLEITSFGEFHKEIPFKNKARIHKLEITLFNKLIKKPDLDFQIFIKLILTNIQGSYICYKKQTFSIPEIEDVVIRLNDKNNGRYNDRDIWDSLCRVERAKVSNKMRFSIYQRDGYRCRICGRKTDDLEVDHIFPIAKGGKSTYDNLQTLCHSCNYNKSDSFEYAENKKCPQCGALMKLKNGQYGKFYGCTNFPQCRYTEKIR